MTERYNHFFEIQNGRVMPEWGETCHAPTEEMKRLAEEAEAMKAFCYMINHSK